MYDVCVKDLDEEVKKKNFVIRNKKSKKLDKWEQILVFLKVKYYVILFLKVLSVRGLFGKNDKLNMCI